MAKFAPIFTAIAGAFTTAAPAAAAAGSGAWAIPASFAASGLPAVSAAAVPASFAMPSLATVAGVGGGVLSAGSAVSSGSMIAGQAKLQGRYLEGQAAREKMVAAENAADFEEKQKALKGRNRALLGGSGTKVGSGSSLLASSNFEKKVAVQIRRIREGGDIRSSRLQDQSDLELFAGRGAFRTGLTRGGAHLLRGIRQSFAA